MSPNCDPEATGLVCDQILLDPLFLAGLNEATRQQYQGEVTTYCRAPRRR